MFLNYNLNLPLDIYLYYLLQDTFCKYSKSIAKDTWYSLDLFVFSICYLNILVKQSKSTYTHVLIYVLQT